METININLTRLEDATSKFNSNHLNEELDSYIISCSNHFIKPSQIVLEVNNLPQEDQAQFIKLIHNYYQHKVKELKNIDKYDDYFRLFFILLGVILIIISEQFTSLISELFLIAGWVVVWEVVYDLLFTSKRRKRDLKIAKKLATCQINFLN